MNTTEKTATEKIATEKIATEKNVTNENTTTRNNKKIDVNRMLGYSAAALSVVSFLTTLQGLKGIVTNSTFFAILISFGIQSIILVMGLWFVPAVKAVWGQGIKKWLSFIISILMLAAYGCSIIFSSFFSFVHLSTNAYSGVRPIDYNMELELFLVENTREIKNVNDAISTVLIQNIRETAPKFRTLVDEYQTLANQAVQDLTAERKKNETAVIPEEERFDAQTAINAYESVGRRATQSVIDNCQRMENDVNAYIVSYENQYYPEYLRHFERMISQTDTSEASARKSDVSIIREEITSIIGRLEEYGYTDSVASVDNYVKGRCSAISRYYRSLLRSLQEIENAYDEMLNTSTISQNEDLDLQNFYETIYSNAVLTETQLESAEKELRRTISAYIANSEAIDEDSVANLSLCIEYISALNQSRELKEEIEKFEGEELSVTYIVSVADAAQNSTTDSGGTNVGDAVKSGAARADGVLEIDEDTWNNIRHKDISRFISLVKSLPDLNLVLANNSELQSVDDVNTKYLMDKSDTGYISNVLSKTYEYSRSKLESISSMEEAWNYLRSQNRFLAVFCCSIAFFLDFASLFIGLYRYFERGKEESSQI